MENNNIFKEEELKANINNLLAGFSQQGLSAGTIYYVLKDCFREYEEMYNKFVNEQYQKLQQEKQQKEEE